MKILNEEFTVKFAALYDTARGKLAAFVLSQPCPVNTARTLDVHMKLNDGKAAAAMVAMPVGTVVNIAEALLTNDSYNRNAKKAGEPADWRDQVGVLLTGPLTIVSVPAAPIAPDDDAPAAPKVKDTNLPF